MEETMLILSKGVKWLVVASASGYLAGTTTTPDIPLSGGHEVNTVEVSHEVAPFPPLGINEVMHMLAR